MSKRSLVQTFAAHIALQLNSVTDAVDVVEINLGTLDARLSKSLAQHRGKMKGLVGAGVFQDQDWEDPSTRDSLARYYFEQVLERRLFLARNEPVQSAHQLFQALCRRGCHADWAAAELVRTTEAAACSSSPPPDYRHVSDALARQAADISPGNPARTRQTEVGPLLLRVGTDAVVVAEELSVWGAISSAPKMLRHLPPGEPFNAFCSLVIKAVEAANAHYGALISLGLSPVHWSALSINTAKQASAFLGLVKRLARETERDPNSLDVWRHAWEQRHVPGYDTADQFWVSELGESVRGRRRDRHVEMEAADEIAADEQGEERFLDRLTFDQMLDRAEDDGVISTLDSQLLRDLYAGEPLNELEARPDVEGILGGTPLRAHVAALAQRIRRHGEKSLSGRPTPTQNHTDK